MKKNKKILIFFLLLVGIKINAQEKIVSKELKYRTINIEDFSSLKVYSGIEVKLFASEKNLIKIYGEEKNLVVSKIT